MGILEDLRDGKPCRWTGVCGEMSAVGGCTCGEAADVIERLRKERDGIREAMRVIENLSPDPEFGEVPIQTAQKIARAALKENS